MMTRFLLIFFFAGISISCFSQAGDCERTLSQASAEFEAGRFYGLPSLLKPCIDNGFSKEQKVRAYLLLTQTYLIIDDPIAAENSYLQLLTVDPEYVANPKRDPVDVYYLSKKFTTTPLFTPSFQGGINTSFVRTIYSLNTSSYQNKLTTSNILKIGYQVGGALDWNISNHWSLSLGMHYSYKSFKTTHDDTNETNKRTFTEKQDWLDVPICIKYSYDSGKVRPFAFAGIAANLLLGAKISPEEVDYHVGSTSNQTSQSPDQSIYNSRYFFNRSLVFGGGVKYKVGKNFFTFSLRYMAGLNNLTRKVYSDKLTTGFEYSSDYFRLDNLSFSIGYVKPLYEPRKKKKTVAGLLQKLGLKKR